MSVREVPLALQYDVADRHVRSARRSAALWLATATVLALLLIALLVSTSRIVALEAQLRTPPVSSEQRCVPGDRPRQAPPLPAGLFGSGRH